MGVMDTLKGLIGGHKDQTKKGIDEAAKVAEKKEGGAHSAQIDAAADKAKDEVDNL